MLIERKTSARLAEWMREVSLGQQPKRRYPKAYPDLYVGISQDWIQPESGSQEL